MNSKITTKPNGHLRHLIPHLLYENLKIKQLVQIKRRTENIW